MWIHEHELWSNQSSWVYKGPTSLLVGSDGFTSELWWRPQCQWGGNGNPLQYSCLENPTGRGACWATVHGVAELDTTEWLTPMQGQSTEPCVPQAESSWRHLELKAQTPLDLCTTDGHVIATLVVTWTWDSQSPHMACLCTPTLWAAPQFSVTMTALRAGGWGLAGPVIKLQEKEEKDAGVSCLKGRKQWFSFWCVSLTRQCQHECF